MKTTKTEKSWIVYDVANSAVTMIMSTTIPIYFAGLSAQSVADKAAITGYYGTATSISVLILAILSPILGAIADFKGMKMKMFTVSMLIGVLGLFSYTMAGTWIWFLVFFIVSKLGYSACNVFYDSMLTDVTTDDRMDEISSLGYALGYIGSCIPFIAGIVILFLTDFSMIGFRFSFLITAVWWLSLSIPLLKNVKQTHFLQKEPHIIKNAFLNLAKTLKELTNNKKTFFFIIAYFFYIDGVYTIISMATSYGTEVGIESTQLILALLLTQFVAFPCAILAGKLGKKYGALKLVKIFIVMYFLICVFAFQLDTALEFWILAVCVGMCQGGIQALSRSHFAKLIPKEKSNEYFGFFDIFGKFADFFGPIIISISAFVFNASRYGILCIGILFIIGFLLLLKSEKYS